MINLQEIEGFEWDEGNARKNEKHGVTQSEAEQVFFNKPLLMSIDEQHCMRLGLRLTEKLMQAGNWP